MSRSKGGNVANLKSWKKGQSGNPGGRPKAEKTLTEMARAHTRECVETLVRLMQESDTPPQTRAYSANAILDRGWGKPRQAIDLETRLSLGEEFEAFVRSLKWPTTAVVFEGEVASEAEEDTQH